MKDREDNQPKDKSLWIKRGLVIFGVVGAGTAAAELTGAIDVLDNVGPDKNNEPQVVNDPEEANRPELSTLPPVGSPTPMVVAPIQTQETPAIGGGGVESASATPSEMPSPVPSETSKPTGESVSIPESITGQRVYLERMENGKLLGIVNNNSRFGNIESTGQGPLTTEQGNAYMEGLIRQAWEATGGTGQLPEFWNQDGPITWNGNVFLDILDFQDLPQEVQEYQRTGRMPTGIAGADGITTVLDLIDNFGWKSGWYGPDRIMFSLFSMRIDENGNAILAIATDEWSATWFDGLSEEEKQRAVSGGLTALMLQEVSLFRDVIIHQGRPWSTIGEGGHYTDIENPPGDLDAFFPGPADDTSYRDFTVEAVPLR